MDGKNSYLGGIARGNQQREEALVKYYENPVVCLYCHNIIVVKENEKISKVRQKKFCDTNCVSNYKKINAEDNKGKVVQCQSCGDDIILKKKKSGYNHRSFCDKCLNRGEVAKKTKKELFDDCKNWQCARSSIQKMARRVYNESQKPKCCIICGYDKHYEVCHINPVSLFNDDDLISDINHIDNLMALCPNHHWEFDNGVLKI